MTAGTAPTEAPTMDRAAAPSPSQPHAATRRTPNAAADGQRTANEPQRASEQPPEDDLLARILAHDPAPALTEERREEMRRGWSELIAEYEAEHGAFTEEELAQARASLSPLD